MGTKVTLVSKRTVCPGNKSEPCCTTLIPLSAVAMFTTSVLRDITKKAPMKQGELFQEFCRKSSTGGTLLQSPRQPHEQSQSRDNDFGLVSPLCDNDYLPWYVKFRIFVRERCIDGTVVEKRFLKSIKTFIFFHGTMQRK